MRRASDITLGLLNTWHGSLGWEMMDGFLSRFRRDIVSREAVAYLIEI